jgi:hypothetical protein
MHYNAGEFVEQVDRAMRIVRVALFGDTLTSWSLVVAA